VTNLQIPTESSVSTSSTKPIELYAFIDPMCSSCWDLQPILRKLQVEYEHYFTLRVVLSTQLATLNSKSELSTENEFTHPALPSVAIKAAELQGKRAGIRFLQKLQEQVFLDTKNVTTYKVLLEIAKKAHLDVDEFEADIKSKDASRAFQCDLYISREMDVTEVPSIVFFNERIEDEGLKVCGVYQYDVYEKILEEMLDKHLVPQEPPSLDDLFKRYNTLSTKEIASIYGVTNYAAERELKKRTLLQQLERIPASDTVQWRLR
jgi:predicted DsbA family dithiol-disulfide isomerase